MKAKEKKLPRSKNNGFVALFTVTIISFLAILFMITAMPRSWMQARNVGEFRSGTEAKFGAFSCIHIARQKLSELEAGDSIEEIIGNYYTGGNGSSECEIEEVRRQGGRFFVQTHANKNGINVSLEAALDSQTFEIQSITEID